MQKIGNYISLGFLWLFSLQPFFILYLYSDLLYHVIRLIGYRRSVINKNLRYSFPDKSQAELRDIRLKFYRNFCDVMVETIKVQSMTEKQMRQRVKWNNSEVIDRFTHQGKDVIAVMGHYCNWEWIPSINLNVDCLGCATYRPLKNKEFDKYMLKLRGKWGTKNFTMADTIRELIKLRRRNVRYIIGLIADQSPGKKTLNYWTNFLNQNTAVILGPEKIAKSTKSPVVYLDMQRVKRGYYEVNVIPVSDDPLSTEEYEITEKHLRLLEDAIKRKPENWLWSHKRWKYSENREISEVES
ncbi:lysophospholipid acyltransferase family protein [Carboxylicivirga sp. A043]|uniref:lysophospholipid acyltransferase family protein n=1 Tax=Carboxylicivirga litoralis TaxID=2816963 RepID=UPI0021CB3A81|nr:lysophospholipid acyltransferase family protein [Carboxylicivirga sp. A043]MCU4155001.1 lysophospholipid acyltransferase family protein [Carboxylicivirga sp. A043]